LGEDQVGTGTWTWDWNWNWRFHAADDPRRFEFPSGPASIASAPGTSVCSKPNPNKLGPNAGTQGMGCVRMGEESVESVW